MCEVLNFTKIVYVATIAGFTRVRTDVDAPFELSHDNY